MHSKFSFICKQNLNKQENLIKQENFKQENLKSEYSLKQNLFDPTKSSPPNDFMLKLKQRMTVYNNSIFYEEKIDNNLDSE